MKVVVETPKHSFTKYLYVDGEYRVEFRSPLPTLFNYGFVEGTVGQDGRPVDAIVLGKWLKQGTEVDVLEVGTVGFTDDGLADDKKVASADGTIGFVDRLRVYIFFTTYALFKIIRYLVVERRLARCVYRGFTRAPQA